MSLFTSFRRVFTAHTCTCACTDNRPASLRETAYACAAVRIQPLACKLAASAGHAVAVPRTLEPANTAPGTPGSFEGPGALARHTHAGCFGRPWVSIFLFFHCLPFSPDMCSRLASLHNRPRTGKGKCRMQQSSPAAGNSSSSTSTDKRKHLESRPSAAACLLPACGLAAPRAAGRHATVSARNSTTAATDEFLPEQAVLITFMLVQIGVSRRFGLINQNPLSLVPFENLWLLYSCQYWLNCKPASQQQDTHTQHVSRNSSFVGVSQCWEAARHRPALEIWHPAVDLQRVTCSLGFPNQWPQLLRRGPSLCSAPGPNQASLACHTRGKPCMQTQACTQD